MFNKLAKSLAELNVMPGMVVLVGRKGKVLLRKAYGNASLMPRKEKLTANHIYDLASLTKVVAATSAIAMLVAEKRLRLDDRIVTFIPALKGKGKEKITVRQAMVHCAGFREHHPFYRGPGVGCRQSVIGKATALPLEYRPGAKTVYSDIGFMLCGYVAEVVSGVTLDVLLAERLFRPLGMKNTCFNPLSKGAAKKRIVPTEKCPWRKKVVRGEVHDENAAAMGGVSGHAGLFSTASDLALFAQEMLRAVAGKGKVLGKGYREFLKHHPSKAGGTRALGWDTNISGYCTGGHLLSPGSVGMTGFTGTSLWVDFKRGAYIIILSNRVHPTRTNNAFPSVRPLLHDLLVRELL